MSDDDRDKIATRYVSIALIAVGSLLIVISAVIAYISFHGYNVLEIKGSSIDEAIVSLVHSLADLAARLGFLGIIVWAGGILLKYGVQLLKS